MSLAPSVETELALRVHRKDTIADGVARLTLRRPDGRQVPCWEPGAHVDLLLPGDIVRQYSLCGDPADREQLQIAVLREPGGRGGSAYVHDQLRPGAPVQMRGPRNHFRLVEAERYLLVAGGIGITPLVPMIAQLDGQGAEWRLLYGGRARASMAFVDELSDCYGSNVDVWPQDEAGLLPLRMFLRNTGPGTAVYCCGPEPLLAAVEGQAREDGITSIHTERFTATAIADHGAAFEIELERSGISLDVPKGRSILEVVRKAGIAVLSSCQEGTCGTCETRVLDGVVDHRDCILSDEEQGANDTMMICVSRAANQRLVLDL